ncbi:unnamed protein product [Rotaria magnacalcarata]|uniref:Uncharacterized protein n=2 Tax=Rotaria magnacalcarata TaxID=392030 RepID=A0A816M8H2_9BILA|nr:unnamed protein product [Rotaria magnacalcarata]CAF3797834.1 unnamed protein product [Rotaria magnacalcarata]
MSSRKIFNGGHQDETLEERLNKRRHMHNRGFLDRKSLNDESETILNYYSPTKTQSLDRLSRKRTISSNSPVRCIDQQKSSLIINENLVLPSIENSSLKTNHTPANDKIESSPHLPYLSKNQSIDFENEKQDSTKSLPSIEQQSNEKSIITERIVPSPVKPSTTVEKSDWIQQEIEQHSTSDHDEKSAIRKENDASILPPIIPCETTEKSNAITQETFENPDCKWNKEVSRAAFSHPQSNTDRQEKYSNYSSFALKPITRTTSEQIISKNKSDHQLINPKELKVNHLALSYLFSKRFVDIESDRTSSLDREQAQQKTIWD